MEEKSRKSYQLRALFRKAFTLQLRQKGTNFCQIFTPILCLLLVYLMKSIAENQIQQRASSPQVFTLLPRLLNTPLAPPYILYRQIGVKVYTCQEWYTYHFQEGDQESFEFIGNLTGEFFHQDNSTTRSGLLQYIPNYYCKHNQKRNPYFVLSEDQIDEYLYKIMQKMDKIPYHHNGGEIYGLLPDGTLDFEKARQEEILYTVRINDHKFSHYHRANGVTKQLLAGRRLMTFTDGMLKLVDMFNQALFNAYFEDAQILSMVQYMPVSLRALDTLNRVLNLLGASLYPIALALLLPVFMYAIVLEKEEKLQDFMKMNGMKIMSYWVVNFVFDFFIYAMTVGIFMVFGYFIVELEFFTQTNKSVLFLFLTSWGIAQIGLAFFIQVFISKARTATIWGYLFSVWTILWGVTISIAIFPLPTHTLPWVLYFYPHFSMSRGIYILSYNCGFWKCLEYWHQIPDQMYYCIFSLFFMGIFLISLSIYLNEIVPREFGVPKHPLFCFRKTTVKKPKYIQLDSLEKQQSLSPDLQYEQQDQAVKQQRKTIKNLQQPYSDPLVVKNLTKIYKGVKGKPDKIAVKQMCLRIEEGEMFGLLGPNGAGKTTLISMLTGLHKPNSGNAWIAGYDIATQLDQVQLHMGVCPQFDILWPELTVKQHLLFYARLKGISPSEQESSVLAATDSVFLTKFKHLKANQLSGGMRRRLSVAICMVGNPRIIFLDEPTTGLDPQNRRQLWTILDRCREGRAIILTTHSMEEADVLCTKIAIVDHGVLRCIGPQLSLKLLYGGGYHLYVNARKALMGEDQEGVMEGVKKFVEKSLPSAGLLSQFSGNLIYQVPLGSCQISDVFDVFEDQKDSVGIDDWGISQSSLEDVFMKVIGLDQLGLIKDEI